jgi:hypothetical protein
MAGHRPELGRTVGITALILAVRARPWVLRPRNPRARGRIADGGSPNFRLEAHQLFQHVASDPATPPDLLELIQARGRAVTEAMRQLVTEVQADGEAARDDPDQLVTAVMACLDGLGRLALGRPGQAAEHFPSAGIIARMLQLSQPQQPGRAAPCRLRPGLHLDADAAGHDLPGAGRDRHFHARRFRRLGRAGRARCAERVRHR